MSIKRSFRLRVYHRIEHSTKASVIIHMKATPSTFDSRSSIWQIPRKTESSTFQPDKKPPLRPRSSFKSTRTATGLAGAPSRLSASQVAAHTPPVEKFTCNYVLKSWGSTFTTCIVATSGKILCAEVIRAVVGNTYALRQDADLVYCHKYYDIADNVQLEDYFGNKLYL